MIILFVKDFKKLSEFFETKMKCCTFRAVLIVIATLMRYFIRNSFNCGLYYIVLEFVPNSIDTFMRIKSKRYMTMAN